MKLLLSNDDGISAEGIHALARALSEHHEVFVSAPATQQSAVSRAMTLFTPLRANPYPLPGLPGVPAYEVTGTPVDCVRLGLGNLFDKPDMVISGINLGQNLGTDVLYSGTVAAAHEAALLGYQAIAMSCLEFRPKHMDTSARIAVFMTDYLAAHPLPFGTLLNVNVPDLPMEELRGIQCAPICVEEYALPYIERLDPRGGKYYWSPRERITSVGTADIDEYWASRGYVTVTPLGYDLTCYSRMDSVKSELEGTEQWKGF